MPLLVTTNTSTNGNTGSGSTQTVQQQESSQLSTKVGATLDAQFGPDKVNIPALVKNADGALASLRATSDQANAAVTEIGRTARRLNEKDGPVDRLAEGAQAMAHAADAFNAATLPRINRVTEDTSRAVRQLSRTVNGINDNPQSLIFGSGRPTVVLPARPRWSRAVALNTVVVAWDFSRNSSRAAGFDRCTSTRGALPSSASSCAAQQARGMERGTAARAPDGSSLLPAPRSRPRPPLPLPLPLPPSPPRPRAGLCKRPRASCRSAKRWCTR
mgnify:CR=1 FL=1